jgi:N-acetylglutamate synthase-like GNAT family acetyltransferase
MKFEIIELNACDKSRVTELLKAGGLRTEDVLEEGTRYWGAFADGELIGAIGCEYENGCGLLRSAIVREQYRGNGIAAQLTEALLEVARETVIEAVYLFSTDAGAYWERLGFNEVAVQEVVMRMPDAFQVRLFDRLGWLPTEVAYKYKL